MKTVILAGGRGTRLSEETSRIPKPMVEIDGQPIISHIMKIYSYFGYNDFIVCLGYKGYMIKSYFKDYYLHNSDITFDLSNDKIFIHDNRCDKFKITLVDTGIDTPTVNRIKQIQKYIGNEQFMLTYGDAVANVNIQNLIDFHNNKKTVGTITAVQVPGRFGSLKINGDYILDFEEKIPSTVNGGFMVFEPEIFNYFTNENEMLEMNVLPHLAHINQLKAYRHTGCFMPMDSLHDKFAIEDSIKDGKLPWMEFI